MGHALRALRAPARVAAAEAAVAGGRCRRRERDRGAGRAVAPEGSLLGAGTVGRTVGRVAPARARAPGVVFQKEKDMTQ